MRKWILTLCIFYFSVCIIACSRPELQLEKVKIRVLINSNDLYFNPLSYYEEAAERFQKLHPHIEIAFEELSNESVNTPTPLAAVLETMSPPDVVAFSSQFSYEDYLSAAQKELLYDFRMIYETKGYDIRSDIIDASMLGDQLLLLPYAVKPSVVYYNKKLLDHAGISYPDENWSWDQFNSYAELINKMDNNSLGSTLEPNIGYFSTLLNYNGGNIIDHDGSSVIGYLDSSEAADVLRWLSVYKEHTPIDTSSILSGDSVSNLLDGKVALLMWNYGDGIDINVVPEHLGVAVVPQFVPDNRYNAVSTESYGISSKSQHIIEAVAFVEFLTFDASSDKRKYIRGYFPTSRAVMDDYLEHSDDPRILLVAQEMERSGLRLATIHSNFYKVWGNEWDNRFGELLEAEVKEQEKMLHELAASFDVDLKLWMEMEGGGKVP